jgi:NitT/TauT family transport system permease protein
MIVPSLNAPATDLRQPSPFEAPVESLPRPRAGGAWRFRDLIAVLAPAAVTAAALLAHRYLPNRQTPVPTALYPHLLEKMLFVSLVLAAAPFSWRRIRPWMRHHAPLLAGGVALLACWDLVTLKWAWLPLPFFPGPDMVLRSLVEDRVLLLVSTWHSLELLATGYLSGVAAGLVTGLLIGWFQPVRYWGMPVLKIVGPVPATALIPVAMLLCSEPFMACVFLIAAAAWFPVTVLTLSGITNVPVAYLEIAQTLGAKRGYLIFRVAVPAAAPTIFIGLFMGLTASFLTLIAAETAGVKDGLGWYLNWQHSWADCARVYGTIVIMACFFSAIMTLLFKARDRVLAWQKGLIRW